MLDTDTAIAFIQCYGAFFIMTKFRIKKHVCNKTISFEVQKKVWFIPFWYNFNNKDGYETGFYNTYDEAVEAIKQHKSKCVISYTVVE